ncbi:phosphotransferase [Streptosporangiaceae bacterium NEAU-GS5]|nr:phosphotransferase [Streptosporangiaceae bacterium NEAU-GS5]
MNRTVGGDGTSAVADALAAPWGVAAGRARFWRSSATHVFVIEDPAFPHGARFLRAVPAARRTLEEIDCTARLVVELDRRGLGVATPAASRGGRWGEHVRTALGAYHVMMVEAAPGRTIEADQLSVGQAGVWGAALAALHECAVDMPGLRPKEERRIEAVFPDDPELVAAITPLIDRLAALPRDAARFGPAHNDFEPDNLAWQDERLTAFDFDEAGPSWFAADVAAATEDLRAEADPALFDAFVRGYRSVKPLEDGELALLPLFDLVRATDRLILIHGVLDLDPGAAYPEWLVRLRARLETRGERLRRRILRNSCHM